MEESFTSSGNSYESVSHDACNAGGSGFPERIKECFSKFSLQDDGEMRQQ
jgi:hypothetical protein